MLRSSEICVKRYLFEISSVLPRVADNDAALSTPERMPVFATATPRATTGLARETDGDSALVDVGATEGRPARHLGRPRLSARRERDVGDGWATGDDQPGGRGRESDVEPS